MNALDDSTRGDLPAPSAQASGNPVFEAYVRRSAPTGLTARQALVLALAENGASAEGAKATSHLSSYGVTRAPMEAAPAVPKAATIRLARREKTAPRLPDADMPAPSAPIEDTTAVVAPPAVAQVSSVAAEEPPVGTGKLKVSLRRPGSMAPTIPKEIPPADTPFLTGPEMDGTRAPLMPIPGTGFGAPLLPLPGSAMTQAQPALAPLDGAGSTDLPEEKPVAIEASERSVWWGRVAVAALATAFLVLGANEWRQRALWPFQAEVQTAVSHPTAAGATPAPFWTINVTGSRPEPAAAAPAAHPTASRDFVQLVERFKITGVLQTNPVRAIVDGRIVEAGDLVDVAREVRLVGLDMDRYVLIFQDKSGARATMRY